MAEYAMRVALEDGPVRLLRWPNVPVYTMTDGTGVIGGLQRSSHGWECWRKYGSRYEWFEDEDLLTVIQKLWASRQASQGAA